VLLMSDSVVWRGMSNSRILCSECVVIIKVTLTVSGELRFTIGWEMLALQQATIVNTGMLNFGFQCG
jgi:hypothetical protein